MRPLVGVTISNDRRRQGHFSLRRDYLRAVEGADMAALIPPPLRQSFAAIRKKTVSL